MIPVILKETTRQKATGLFTIALLITGMAISAFAYKAETSSALANDKRNAIVDGSDALQDVQLPAKKVEAQLGSCDSGSFESATTSEGDIVRIVVGLNKSEIKCFSQLAQMAETHRGKIVNSVSIKKEVIAAVVEISNEEVSSFMENACAAGLIDYVEPRLTVQVQFLPDDSYWSVQWGLQKIQADWAWNITLGSHDILVAVLDTGMDWHHPDLMANYIPLGYDWVNNDDDPMDDFGHGTHCAGIVAATSNNGIGIAGLAQVRVMVEKVLDNRGEGYSDWVAKGIIHAVEQGAKVISMSFGDSENSEILHEAVKYAYDSGVLLVAAAGNENTDFQFYPAAYDEVVAVGATGHDDEKASFSNFGAWIELAAPGVDVFSTFLDNNYKSMSGTSMACPHVSGLAALVLSAFPNATANFVRLLLRNTADDLGESDFDIYYGYGRINARTALNPPTIDHELIAFHLTVPPYLKLGIVNFMAAEVFNFGKADERGISMQLFFNGSVVWSHVVDFLASYSTVSLDMEWMPAVEGFCNITFYISPQADEENVNNNFLTKFVYAGSPVKAAVLRSSGNKEYNALRNWNELNSQWRLFGNRMIFVDYVSLNKENITLDDIASTEADVLIISGANDQEFKTSEIIAIEHYVRQGHGLIVTGDSFSENVLNNKRLAQTVGLDRDLQSYWNANSTDLLRILNVSHPLFDKIPNPMILPPVSTVIPDDGQWDSKELAGGQYVALGYHNESAVVEFKGLLYFSLSLESIPPYYHHHLQLLYNTILWSMYEKPPHDLAVSVEGPRYLEPMETTFLNATVHNMGWENESGVILRLLIDGSLAEETTIPELPTGSSRTIRYSWTPTREASYNISANAPLLAGEGQTLDNAETVPVFAHFPKSVLWDTTHARSAQSIGENYLSFRGLLKAEGFHVDDLEKTVIGSQTLVGYDIIVLPTSEIDFSSDEVLHLLEWVAQGGSMFVIVDVGFDSTLRMLTLPFGVQIYREELPGEGITSSVVDHPMTHGVGSIYYAMAERLEVKLPSQVLAWTVLNSRVFNLVTATENREVVIISGGHMIDNKGVARADNEQLIMNIFHCFAIRSVREHDIAITLETPAFVQTDQTVLLNATVRNLGSCDETNIGAYMLVNNSVIESVTIPHLPTGGTYTLSHSWTPLTSGNYNITVYVSPVLGENFTANNLVTREMPVFFYERHYFPNSWIGMGDPMEWHGDDSCWSYVLPFSFPFYTGSYRTLFISSNGLITFTGPDTTQNGSTEGLGNKLTIAVAWHNWATYDPFDIYIGQPDSTHLVIRWEACDNSSAIANFAVMLGQDGVIQLFYGYSNQSVSAIIGISNGAGHMLAERARTIDLIHTVVFVPFRLEHEVAAGIEAPNFVSYGSSVTLNATVSNLGLDDETDINLQLIINGSIVDSTLISNLRAGSFNATSWLWSPEEEGKYNISTYVSPIQGEVYLGNNLDTKMVFVLRNISSYVSLDPQTVIVGVGENFTVGIVVNNVENLYAWQVMLDYDSTILRCLEAWVPSDNVFAGRVPIYLEPLIGENYTVIGATLTGAGRPFTGVGVLCRMKFRADSAGNSALILDANNTILLDPGLRFIGHELVDGDAEVRAQVPAPDFNHDGRVDLSDLIVVADAFGSHPGEGRWNQACDLNNDSEINILDLAIVVRAFGKTPST